MKNTPETRIDQIERYIVEFAKGMLELKDGILEMKDGISELKEAQLKTDAQIFSLKETHRQTEELLQNTIKEFRATQKSLGDLGLVQGEVADDLFYRNVKGLFSPLDLRFKRIRRNVKVKGQGEYDIVADDKGRVLVIEVKNKLSRRMVDDFKDKKLPRFKALLPEYRDSKILAGIGALVVKDDVGRYAEKAGLFVLTQTSDGGAALLNRKGFKPKEFA
ncbi:MAG: hypothetical protein V2B19_21200 [Pseudomonadota bacterium]